MGCCRSKYVTRHHLKGQRGVSCGLLCCVGWRDEEGLPQTAGESGEHVRDLNRRASNLPDDYSQEKHEEL